jgi:MFS family permease
LISGSLESITGELGDPEITGWIPSAWSVTSAVSFSLAGEFSDIYGRKIVILVGQVITLIGAVSVIRGDVQLQAFGC